MANPSRAHCLVRWWGCTGAGGGGAESERMSSASYQASHKTSIWYIWWSQRPALKKRKPYSYLSQRPAHVFATHETFDKYLLNKRIYKHKGGTRWYTSPFFLQKNMATKVCMSCDTLTLQVCPSQNKQQPGVGQKPQPLLMNPGKVTEGAIRVMLAFPPSFPRCPPHCTEWSACPFCGGLSAPSGLTVHRLQPLLREEDFNQNPASLHDLIISHWLNGWQ